MRIFPAYSSDAFSNRNKEFDGDYTELIVLETVSIDELKNAPVSLRIGSVSGVSELFCSFNFLGDWEIKFEKVLIMNDLDSMMSFNFKVVDGEVRSVAKGVILEKQEIKLQGLEKEQLIQLISEAMDLRVRMIGKKESKDYYIDPDKTQLLKDIIAVYEEKISTEISM